MLTVSNNVHLTFPLARESHENLLRVKKKNHQLYDSIRSKFAYGKIKCTAITLNPLISGGTSTAAVGRRSTGGDRVHLALAINLVPCKRSVNERCPMHYGTSRRSSRIIRGARFEKFSRY